MQRIFFYISFIMLFSLKSTVSAETFHFGECRNPEGHTIEVDAQGFLFDGQPVIPVMGEIHFSRVPEREWRREVQKMKAGGVTVIATYVFWNHHEYEEGRWDWSGNRNLRKFVQICKEEQMPVVLRIGPFCHGEVWQGGFPGWLTDKAASDENYKLRSTAAGFMEETRMLYATIASQVSDMVWREGGPIIGVQIENESRGPWPYLQALKDIAVKVGFDVPFYTRTGWPRLSGPETFGELLPLYGDYADGFWDRSIREMPGDYPKAFLFRRSPVAATIATETFSASEMQGEDAGVKSYPYLTCELGGGMMTSYHRRINISGREALPLAICKLGSGSNLLGYYMYHGGSNPWNPHHTMAETQDSPVTNYNDLPHISYDFQAPLGEMGQPQEVSFQELRLLHLFLQSFGGLLRDMPVDTLSDHYARRGCFVFRNDYVRILNEKGSASIILQRMPFQGHTVTTSTSQPLAAVGNHLYLVEIPGEKPSVSIDGAAPVQMKFNQARKFKNITVTVLSRERAYQTYFVGDSPVTANGLLYDSGSDMRVESWTVRASFYPDLLAPCEGLRDVPMGPQQVSAQPRESDFLKAARWNLWANMGGEGAVSRLLYEEMLRRPDNYYLCIHYVGDCARVWGSSIGDDGMSGERLVQDNFWNGKPMWVRFSDVSKTGEVQVLPVEKRYPIYFQREQRAILDPSGDEGLCRIDRIDVIERQSKALK